MNELDYQRILTAFFLRWVQNFTIGDIDPYIDVNVYKSEQNQGLIILQFLVKPNVKAFWDPTIQIPKYFNIDFEHSLSKLTVLVDNIPLPDEIPQNSNIDVITYYFLTSAYDTNSFEHLVNIIKLYDSYPCNTISNIIEDYQN